VTEVVKITEKLVCDSRGLRKIYILLYLYSADIMLYMFQKHFLGHFVNFNEVTTWKNVACSL